jgi:cytochrome c biogenesis protein CcdA/thiol-disulfide isomerase/thioredoxin
MILLVVSYLGGVLTILSPCILPVLPFVFARADQPFVKSGLPLLVGMALTFAAVASLAAIGGGWAVEANQYGRAAALALLALFGVTLLFPEVADQLARPLVALGARLSQKAADETRSGGSIAPSFVLGIATGLLWAPCAGPILGLVLTGAALQGANAKTSLLLLAYAAGTATSLAIALLIGGRVFAAMKHSLGVSEWIRRGLGLAVLAGVAAIALGLDTGFLNRLSTAPTAAIEQALVDKTNAKPQAPSLAMNGNSDMMMSGVMAAKPMAAADDLPVEGNLPPLSGAVAWLNSPPLTAQALRGKVVLVDFWTYSCINCLRSLPYVHAWADKYRDKGLIVIGVHAPEFAFEKDVGNVRRAVRELNLDYPIAIDNNYAIWNGFGNEYWPAHYLIDAEGRIRHHHFGEGDYAESEKIIQQLLAEAGRIGVASNIVNVSASGAEAAADITDVLSPETYIGYERAQNFASTDAAAEDAPHVYGLAPQLQLNQWGLTGNWTIGDQHAVLNEPGGTISYRFHARDLHLVLGPGPGGKPVHFRILIDGKAPGGDRGVDVDTEGNGTVTEHRLYQLIRQSGAVDDRTFEIQFLDANVQAFAFTFG